MPTILDARAIITGEDRSGAAFASFEKKVAGLSRSVGAVNRVSGSLSSLSNVVASRKMVDGLSNFEEKMASAQIIDGMSRMGIAAEVASRKLSMLQRTMGGMQGAAASAWKNIGPFAEGAAGMGLLHATKKAIEAGASLQGVRVRMEVAGLPPTEIAASEKQSFDLAQKYSNLTPAELMQTYLETRSVLVKPEETPGMMQTMASARSVLKALGKGDEAADNLILLSKSAETMGIAQDPARFRAYVDAIIRANEVLQGTIDPKTVQKFAQQMKLSSTVFSDRFIMTTGSSLIQDLQSRGGAGLSGWLSLMSGQMEGKEAEEWKKLGFLKESDILRTRTGKVVGLKHGHHIKHFEEAISDPDLFVWNLLKPALIAHGYDTRLKQIAEIAALVKNQRPQNVIGKLLAMEPSFKQQAVKFSQAQGLEGALTALHKDPTTALNAFTTSLQKFGSTLTDPAVKMAAPILNSITDEIGSFAGAIEKFNVAHPEWSKVTSTGAILGGLGVGGFGVYKMFSGFMGGFGLKTSATALDASAAALTEAAAKLGASGLPASIRPSASKLPSTLGTFGLFGAALGLAIEMPDPVAESKKAAAAALKNNPHALDAVPDVEGWDRWTGIRGANAKIAQFEDELDDWFHVGAPTPDVGHIGADIASQLSVLAQHPLTAKLEGTGDVDVTLSIKLDPGLIQDQIKKQLRSSGNISVRANTGTSMPEAAPDRGAR